MYLILPVSQARRHLVDCEVSQGGFIQWSSLVARKSDYDINGYWHTVVSFPTALMYLNSWYLHLHLLPFNLLGKRFVSNSCHIVAVID